MDARYERGLAIARAAKIDRLGEGRWTVPSQSGDGRYVVVEEMGIWTCSCPDHETRGVVCKHAHAVQIALRETVTETNEGRTTTTTREVRVTYSQDWPAYNRAQTEEKKTVQSLLRSLCNGVVTPAHNGRGPKPLPLADVIYGMTMKVYTTSSGRRATTDIEECAGKGHMAHAPRYNTLFDAFGKPELTPVLVGLIEQSARPLAAVETAFAIDSTGFSTSVYRRWYDAKYGREMREQEWVKAHAMVGTTTNIVTAIAVTDGTCNDSPELPALVAATAQRFDVREVSADKAYLSHANLAAIERAGASPFVPFKSNSQGAGSEAWERMWGLFTYRRPEFLAHYHRRSNVESTFSAIKRKFGGAVRSRKFHAQVNEVLCKTLAFNLTCVTHAIHEMGIEPAFHGPELAS